MRRIGFGEQWIKLTMVCVKTISYSILVNGKPNGIIIQPVALDKRIHFLLSFFLLCIEGLHGLISQEAVLGNLKVSLLVEMV